MFLCITGSICLRLSRKTGAAEYQFRLCAGYQRIRRARWGAGRFGSQARRLQFPGDRSRVRTLACNYALDLLRRSLLAAKT